MKKIVLLVLGIVALTHAFSQSLSVGQKSITVYGQSNANLFSYDTVYNNSNKALTVKLRRFVLTDLPGSLNSFCWGFTCYDPSKNVSDSPLDSVVIQPNGKNGTFKGDLDPQNVNGTAVIKYCVYDKANSTDSACFVVTYNASLTDLEEETAIKFSSPYPNPASDNVNFTYNLPNSTKATIKLYNMLGALVRTVSTNDTTGKLVINTADLNPGLYLYDMQLNGKSYKTGKFTVVN